MIPLKCTDFQKSKNRHVWMYEFPISKMFANSRKQIRTWNGCVVAYINAKLVGHRRKFAVDSFVFLTSFRSFGINLAIFLSLNILPVGFNPIHTGGGELPPFLFLRLSKKKFPRNI